jgi:hypothetical protein
MKNSNPAYSIGNLVALDYYCYLLPLHTLARYTDQYPMRNVTFFMLSMYKQILVPQHLQCKSIKYPSCSWDLLYVL